MRSIGRIIAENRKKKGLSQPKLAELLSQQGIDVTAKAISKWETDAREPGLHVFLTLCKLLDIEDIYDAYFGKNPYVLSLTHDACHMKNGSQIYHNHRITLPGSPVH